MPITMICDECSEPHRVRDDAVGQSVQCGRCGKSFVVKAPEVSGSELRLTPNGKGVSLEITDRGWSLRASTRSVIYAVVFAVILSVCLVGLKSAIVLVRASPASLDGWFVFAFCVPMFLLAAYQAAIRLCGRVEITVDRGQGTIFTGFWVIGRRQRFDWSQVTHIEDECVPAGRGSVAYQIVLCGPSETRFAKSLTWKQEREVLSLLQQLLRQNRRRRRPGAPSGDSSEVATDQVTERVRECDWETLGPEAPKVSLDALVCQGIGWRGKPVAVIVDRTAGLIHFQNCHSPQSFWAISAARWFSCPTSELVSTRYWDPRGKHLMIVTQKGEASITSNTTNYDLMCKTLNEVTPEPSQPLSVTHPLVTMQVLPWLSFTTIGGLFLGWALTPLRASNSALLVRLLIGTAVGAALPFVAALLMRRKRDP